MVKGSGLRQGLGFRVDWDILVRGWCEGIREFGFAKMAWMSERGVGDRGGGYERVRQKWDRGEAQCYGRIPICHTAVAKYVRRVPAGTCLLQYRTGVQRWQATCLLSAFTSLSYLRLSLLSLFFFLS